MTIAMHRGRSNIFGWGGGGGGGGSSGESKIAEGMRDAKTAVLCSILYLLEKVGDHSYVQLKGL